MPISSVDTRGTALLEHLVRIEFDAVAAYAVAIAKLDDPTAAGPLRVLQEDHEQRILKLCELIIQQGGVPPRRDAHRASAPPAPPAGETDALLETMRGHAKRILTAWRQAADRAKPDKAEVAEVLQRGLEDAQRHLDWFDTQLR